jgi:peptide-methionine (R)-S-oxide reductase
MTRSTPPTPLTADQARALTDAEWRERLSPEAYQVLRKAGTERAFTGQYWKTLADGRWCCAACGALLFHADSKFVSMCGWPAFDRQAAPEAITRHEDRTYGMRRVEVRCGNCDSHLGHVFDDGPTETGERYCINSVCLALEPDGGDAG